jgi:hypothetical protein
MQVLNTILIRGSYGCLTVHRTSGVVLAYSHEGEPPAYADILWFDPARLPDEDETDILNTAFADASGTYVRELVWHGGPGADGRWEDQDRLPAPMQVAA